MPIGPSARKTKKESPLSEGLGGLKATLDKGNELLNRAVTAQEHEVGKTVRTLVKDYNEQERRWIAKAIKVLKHEANAQVFNCLENRKEMTLSMQK